MSSGCGFVSSTEGGEIIIVGFLCSLKDLCERPVPMSHPFVGALQDKWTVWEACFLKYSKYVVFGSSFYIKEKVVQSNMSK